VAATPINSSFVQHPPSEESSKNSNKDSEDSDQNSDKDSDKNFNENSDNEETFSITILYTVGDTPSPWHVTWPIYGLAAPINTICVQHPPSYTTELSEMRRSSRKPVPSRKILQALERFPNNPKADLINRSNCKNALKSYLALRKATWDNDNNEMPRMAKRNKRKTCKCENCRDGGICDSPIKPNPETGLAKFQGLWNIPVSIPE
jgi:hypothetical protein